jgi:Domain of unknown function (DUF5658)
MKCAISGLSPRVALALCMMAAAVPAYGQGLSDVQPSETGYATDPTVHSSLVTLPEPANVPMVARALQPPSSLLAGLHVSFGVLQAMDLYSTTRGLRGGLIEINPLMRPAGPHPLAIGAVKTAVGVSTIFLTRRIARRHRVLAIATMAAVNTAFAVVVTHNVRAVARR